MALKFQPFGFSLFEYLGGKPNYSVLPAPLSVNGVLQNLGQGDLVIWDFNNNNSGLTNFTTKPTVANTNTNDAQYTVAGVVEGFNYTQPNGVNTLSPYWAANTSTFQSQSPYVKLNALPNCIFMAQCNAPLPATGAYGYNFYVTGNGSQNGDGTAAVSTVANAQTGQSTQFIDVILSIAGGQGTKGGLSSLNGIVKIIGLAPVNAASPLLQTNSWTDPYPVVLCRINQHQFSAPTPSAG